jgi:ubiquinone/menaquinone biosynthesis C-methylase UbiE
MAMDYGELSRNLADFYDFKDKVVLYVGAGGRQLFDIDTRTKRTIAIDSDGEALGELAKELDAGGQRDWVSVVEASFEDISLPGDVVYFEFCLHEMPDPRAALAHARALAPDTVVFDHLPDSLWSFYTAEEKEVQRGADAVERFGVRRRERHEAQQRFANWSQLRAKLEGQGTVAVERIRRDFHGSSEIVIPMRYQLALL